ncbi:Pycsar system effector family protein [Elongatibacter sediminis]|uniref:Pycsar system effector family protein n=1 Tax=Elongatibacter sediminis TaxID=3119006 RepID=A0AAW9RGP3_9GAMM
MSKDLQRAQAQLEQTETALHAAAEAAKSAAVADWPDPTEDPSKPKKPPGTARGIETMFRSAYRVQMELTSLADNKANMMISINGIIMSIIIASVAPKLDANPWLLLPTALLLVGSMISIVFAILAARPRVSHLPISLEDLRHSEGNILFFGNFANMSEDDFTRGMEDLMADKTLVYDTMIRNIHGLGGVLNQKFALLRYAYTSFMFALIFGVTSFLGVFVWVSQQLG